MRRGRILMIVAIIILLGVLGVVLYNRMLGQPVGGEGEGVQPPSATALSQIVIAAKEIPRGSVILEEDVILSPFPVDLILETMRTSKEDVVGMRARLDIPRGSPVMSSMITELPGDVAEGGSPASFAIPPGKTAIAIPMSRLSGVAYALQDGDQVDVLITLLLVDVDAEFQSVLPNGMAAMYDSGGTQDLPAPSLTAIILPEGSPKGRIEVDPGTGERIYVIPGAAQRPRLVTQRLVASATVLHVGTYPLEEEVARAQAEAAAAEEAAQQGQGEAVVEPAIVQPDIITLIVSPQDALALNWAVKSGADLVLTLRSPGDTTTIETTSVTLQYLLDTYNITVPSKLTISPEPQLSEPFHPLMPNDETSVQ
jgi:Flp pilus assembly protein CpaB